MNLVRRLFANPGFQAVLFALGCILFNWPVLAIADKPGHPSLFSSIFTSWLIMIVVLFFMANRAGASASPPTDTKQTQDTKRERP